MLVALSDTSSRAHDAKRPPRFLLRRSDGLRYNTATAQTRRGGLDGESPWVRRTGHSRRPFLTRANQPMGGDRRR
jgi:hypothetical protein